MCADDLDLDLVRREIAAEVSARRASGSLDALEERRLQRLFEQYSPHAGGVGALSDALRSVDATIYIDPEVPVASSQPAGAAIKKTLRKANYWYMRWITTQTTKALSNIAGVLHQVGTELDRMNRRLDLVASDNPPIIELENSTPWWHEPAVGQLGSVSGRILVAACGEGSLVGDLISRGLDAYGADPRRDVTLESASGLDLRNEGVLDHLEAVADDMLGGIVLTGVTEALLPAQRTWLLRALERTARTDAVFILHVVTPEALQGDRLPVALELAGVTPLRPATWVTLLRERGLSVTIVEAEHDALIVATNAPRA